MPCKIGIIQWVGLLKKIYNFESDDWGVYVPHHRKRIGR